MEMINIRIPSNEFTVTAAANGVVISFAKPEETIENDNKLSDMTASAVSEAAGHTATPVEKAEGEELKEESPSSNNPQEDWFNKELPPRTQGKPFVRRYVLGTDVIAAIDSYRKAHGQNKRQFIDMLAERTGIKATTIINIYSGISAHAAVVEAIEDILNVELDVVKETADVAFWRLKKPYVAETVANDKNEALQIANEVTENENDDSIKKRIEEATKPRSFPDRATLSEGIRELIK